MLVTGIAATPADAAVATVRIRPVQATLYATQTIVLRGTVSKTLRGKRVRIDYVTPSGWKKFAAATASKRGNWAVRVRVPSGVSQLIIRAGVGKRKSTRVVSQVLDGATITTAGPGGYIMGLDISRYQHDAGRAIDWAQMAGNGAAFVIIKASNGNCLNGSDGSKRADETARTWALADSAGARSAGMFVGYYHYAHLAVDPTSGLPTNDATLIEKDAKEQAQCVASRLAGLGGYDGRTLPYTLDLEEDWVKDGNGTAHYFSTTSISRWTRTWVAEMVRLTGRTPMMYSYRSYLQGNFDFASTASTKSTLQSMHVWVAQPGHPEDHTTVVGGKSSGGCYVTAWTKPNCTMVWTLWQYTSGGDRDDFGIPWEPDSTTGYACPSAVNYCYAGRGTGRYSLDVNVFNGTVGDLNALAAGTWVRTPADFAP